MPENNLYVSLQDQALLLLLSEQENDSVFLLAVPLLGRVSELFSDVEASAAVHFEEGHAATA